MDADLAKLIDEAKKTGSEAEKTVKKILNDLDADSKDIQEKTNEINI